MLDQRCRQNQARYSPSMDGWTVAANFATVLACVTSFAGILLAWRTARDQRRNRDFPYDKARADKFEAQAFAVREAAGEGGPNRAPLASLLNAAAAEYGPADRSDERGEIRYIIGRATRPAELALLRAPDEPLSLAETNEIRASIDAARRIAEDWAYPERRRAVMVEGYRMHYADMVKDHSSYPEPIQIRRWLLVGMRSDLAIAQACRVTYSWTERLVYDVRKGRLPRRIRDGLLERRMRRRELAAFASKLSQQ